MCVPRPYPTGEPKGKTDVAPGVGSAGRADTLMLNVGTAGVVGWRRGMAGFGRPARGRPSMLNGGGMRMDPISAPYVIPPC